MSYYPIAPGQDLEDLAMKKHKEQLRHSMN